MSSMQGDVGIRLVLIDEASKAMAATQSRFKGAMQAMKGATLMDAAIIGHTLTNMGGRLSRFADDVVGSFATFDQSMANTRSILQGTQEQFAELERQAKDMSVTMPASASEIADGYYFLASAGYDANTILAVTPEILKLATATATDFSTTANLVTGSLDVFAQQGYTTDQVLDTLMGTVMAFKTTLPELGESFKYSAAAAVTAGISLEELGAATGIIRGNFQDASQAGTAMRMMLMQLADPSDAAMASMEKYGLSIVENADGTLNLTETMKSFQAGLASLPPGLDRVAIMQEIFGTRAATAANALIENADALGEYTETVSRSGTVQDAFDTQMEGTANQLEIARNKMELAKIEMGEAFAPAMISTANATAGLANTLSRLPKPLMEVAGGMSIVGGQAMTTIGPLITMAASLGRLGEMGILTRARLLSMAGAMGATIGIMGALTTDSEKMRAAYSGLAGVMIVYTARKWLQNVADMYGLSIWTMGIGVAVALGAAIYGISAAMHANRQAQEEVIGSSLDLDAALGSVSGSFGEMGANVNATSFLMGASFNTSMLSMGGITTNTMGEIWKITEDAMGGMVFTVTDSMGNIYDNSLEKMGDTENMYRDKWGNIYEITEDELGNVRVKVTDTMGDTYTVQGEALDAMADGWEGTWGAVGRDDSGVLARVVAQVSGAMGGISGIIDDELVPAIDGMTKAFEDWGTNSSKAIGQVETSVDNFYTKMQEVGLIGAGGEWLAEGGLGKALAGEWLPTPGAGMGMPTGPYNDFIIRPGQGIAHFSPDDTVIGVKDPGMLGGGQQTVIHIGPVHINAGTHEGGQAAARGFREEMLRRGAGFTR